jgi:hypothetical protein
MAFMKVTREGVLSSESAVSIKESGAYVGKFEMVMIEAYPSGAQCLKFDFKTADDRKASFKIFFMDKAGNETFGAKSIQALAYLLKCGTEFDFVEKMVDCWDSTSSSMKPKLCKVFDCFLNREIGIIVQKELTHSDKNPNGYENLNFLSFFDPMTNMTASELVGKKTAPEVYKKRMAFLEQNPVKDSRKNQNQGSVPAPPAARGSQQADDLDDDIPF